MYLLWRAFTVVALACATGAHAQTASTGSVQGYPGKPIRLIVPFPPDGGTDATARIITQALAETAGWHFLLG